MTSHVVTRRRPPPEYREEDGQRVMKQSEISIRVGLNRGSASATVWTCWTPATTTSASTPTIEVRPITGLPAS